MIKFIKKFRKDEEGAVTVDWVVLTAAVVGLGVAGVSTVSGGVNGLASKIVTGSTPQTTSARAPSKVSALCDKAAVHPDRGLLPVWGQGYFPVKSSIYFQDAPWKSFKMPKCCRVRLLCKAQPNMPQKVIT